MENKKKNKSSYLGGIAFIRDSLIIFSSNIVSIALKTLASIVLARLLQTSQFGVYSLITQIVGFSVMLGSLGLDVATIYFIGRKKYSEKLVLGNSFTLSLLLSTFIFLILITINPILLKNFLKGSYGFILVLTEITVVFLITYSIYASAFLGQNKMKKYAQLIIANSSILLILTLFFLIPLKLALSGAVIAFFLTQLITVILGSYMLKQEGILSPPLFSWEVIKDLLTYSLKGYFGTLSQFFNYRLDVFIIAYFLNPIQVAYYVIAVKVGEAIWYIPDSISRVLLPRTASSTVERSNQRSSLVARLTLLITAFISLCIFLISGFLLPLVFGSKYSFSILPLRLLLPGIVALSLWKILTNDLAGRGFPQYKSYSSGISLIATVILDLALVPKIGIAGAALASTVAYILGTLIMLYWFLKVTGLSLVEVTIPTLSDVKLLLKTFTKKELRQPEKLVE